MICSTLGGFHGTHILVLFSGHGFGNFSSDLEYLDNMVRLYEMYHLLVCACFYFSAELLIKCLQSKNNLSSILSLYACNCISSCSACSVIKNTAASWDSKCIETFVTHCSQFPAPRHLNVYALKFRILKRSQWQDAIAAWKYESYWQH